MARNRTGQVLYRRQNWSRIWMSAVILVALLLDAFPSVGATGPLADGPPLTGNGTAPQHMIFLPLLLRPGLPSPGDTLIVSWAQRTDAGGRTVVLHWRSGQNTAQMQNFALIATTPTETRHFTVQRRVEGGVWQEIGVASFASSPSAMAAILGSALLEQLRYDLRDSADDPPLTDAEVYQRLQSDAGRAELLSERFYRVGLATGRAFLDVGAPSGKTLEYRVIDSTGRTTYEPVSVPETGSGIPVPTHLREVWAGPDDLGQPGSTRAADVTERYSWTKMQFYHAWDGRVYLIWDPPAENQGNSGDIRAGREALNAVGYRVYRAPHGTTAWTNVTPRKDECLRGGSTCELLVGVNPDAPGGTNTFPAYYFTEDLTAALTDTVQIYGMWDYKVCAVDLLDADAGCATVAVDVREVQPPQPVSRMATAPGAQPNEVTVTWLYSDTTELSTPLRFYVTRSPSLLLDRQSWEPVRDPATGLEYIEAASGMEQMYGLTDIVALGQVFWYRVQVRDDVGNWSRMGRPVKVARYPRTAPPLSSIPYDAGNCAANPLPLALTGLDPSIVLITLSRSFNPAGPFELIRRFPVNNGSVEISDDYVPPYPTSVYYHLQALDHYGNASVQQKYCAQLGDGPAVDPGAVPATFEVTCEPEKGCGYVITATQATSTSLEMAGLAIEVVITQPGENGPISTTVLITDTGVPVTGRVNEGAVVEATASYTYTSGAGSAADGDQVTFLGRQWAILEGSTYFSDTHRYLASLGGLSAVQWMTDDTTGAHYVRVTLANVDEATPPVAVFRRAGTGNWMQVSGVGTLPHHYFDDRSTLMPYENYQYVVLALGPQAYEMLGFWEPITLDPLTSNPPALALSPPMASPPGLPRTCSKTAYTPKAVGGPATILLANGWQINDVMYWLATSGDPDCPSDMQSFSLSHAYGFGSLSNGRETWPIEFYDIGLKSTGAHVDGRIVGIVNHAIGNGTMRFYGTVKRLEFWPSEVNGETLLDMPDGIAVGHRGEPFSGRVSGVFPNVTTSFAFDPLSLGTDAVLVDGNLPWRLHPVAGNIDETRIALGASATTAYGLPGGVSNNLGFLVPPYSSDAARVTPAGLQGTFTTGASYTYTTGFPASFEVAFEGAGVTIGDSQITSGYLNNAGAALNYYDTGTLHAYAAGSRFCHGASREEYSVCTSGVLTGRRRLTMAPHGATAIAVGTEGHIEMVVDVAERAITWPSFAAPSTNKATLYVAAASFVDAPTHGVPMPAENAWRQLSDATGGKLDPGLNLNAAAGALDDFNYDPPGFSNVALDLYVRVGGVSGYVRAESTTWRTNVWGFHVKPRRMELWFLDNSQQGGETEEDLHLPYPTEETLQLRVKEVDTRNRPLSGDFRSDSTVVAHEFWDFVERPATWQYSVVGADEYGMAVAEALSRTLTLMLSQASIPGLLLPNSPPNSSPVTLTFNSEWFPDGDIGGIALATIPAGGQIPRDRLGYDADLGQAESPL